MSSAHAQQVQLAMTLCKMFGLKCKQCKTKQKFCFWSNPCKCKWCEVYGCENRDVQKKCCKRICTPCILKTSKMLDSLVHKCPFCRREVDANDVLSKYTGKIRVDNVRGQPRFVFEHEHGQQVSSAPSDADDVDRYVEDYIERIANRRN